MMDTNFTTVLPGLWQEIYDAEAEVEEGERRIYNLEDHEMVISIDLLKDIAGLLKEAEVVSAEREHFRAILFYLYGLTRITALKESHFIDAFDRRKLSMDVLLPR